jgi:peptidoglycan hydrolase-like protein with peptidoglycan-binding domain
MMKSHASGHGRASVWTTLGVAGLAALATGMPLSAQQRVLLPEGTVLTVRTETPLNSQTARVGQALSTTVTEGVDVEGMMVIPEGTSIDGRVTLARRATSRESGLIGVEFNRLVLPDGRAVTIAGKLTSTDPTERRQIDQQADPRVVFVGGRRGVGATIGAIGAGSANDPVGGFLGALGSILSEGADVNVSANTVIAVQLEAPVTLTGSRTIGDALSTIFTSAPVVRQAQQVLRSRNYYRGPVDGRLSNDTRRALFDFQIDNQIYGTGNLDEETVAALGITVNGGPATGGGFTPAEIATMRRDAQQLTGMWRDNLAITPAGRLDPRRTYTPAELELYFALAGLESQLSLYDQMVRASGNVQGIQAASASLLGTARRVDQAFGALRAPARIVNGWRSLSTTLNELSRRF